MMYDVHAFTCVHVSVGWVFGIFLFRSTPVTTLGLHNMSDCMSLVIAYYAESLKFNQGPAYLTFGYRRTELLGGMFNAMFLVAMSVFIALQCISKFVKPDAISVDEIQNETNLVFLLVSGVGMALNILGVLLFCGHGGGHHGHSHAGGVILLLTLTLFFFFLLLHFCIPSFFAFDAVYICCFNFIFSRSSCPW